MFTPTKHLTAPSPGPTTAAGPQRFTTGRRHHYNKKGGRVDGPPQPIFVFSQVRKPLTGMPGGRACVALRPPAGPSPAETETAAAPAGRLPPLILAGDSFSSFGSRFDGCVASGEDAAVAVLEALQCEAVPGYTK